MKKEKKKTEYQAVFKNAQVEAAYMAACDRTLGMLSVAYETKYVPTPYGDTHIIIGSPEGGEPLVLLHAGQSSSTIWVNNVADLSKTNRIYTVDIMSEPGKVK